MDARVHELLNDQINKELYSAYLYLDISNYFKRVGLDGFANWYYIQAQEERDHAMLFYQYLQNESQLVTLKAIDKPDKVITQHMDALKAGLEHEKYVTSLIHDIYSAAYDVKVLLNSKSMCFIYNPFFVSSSFQASCCAAATSSAASSFADSIQ